MIRILSRRKSVPGKPNSSGHVTITQQMLASVIQYLLSEGRTVVKCICECNQSGRRVVLDPEPVAMSTTFCVWTA